MTSQTGAQLPPINEDKPSSPQLADSTLIYGPRKNYLKIGVPLYEASIKCDWKAAKAIFDEHPELVRSRITENGETSLHVAASAKDPKDVEKFVKNLLGIMEKEDLELQNKNHNTALYLAAAAGNIKAVKLMVEKNKGLLTIAGANGKMMPLYAAVLFGNEDVVKYLYNKSKGLRDDGWTTTNRGWLFEKCVDMDMFDVALEIVKAYPGLCSGTVLGILARKPEVFPETTFNIIWRTTNGLKHLYTKMCISHQPPKNENVGSGSAPTGSPQTDGGSGSAPTKSSQTNGGSGRAPTELSQTGVGSGSAPTESSQAREPFPEKKSNSIIRFINSVSVFIGLKRKSQEKEDCALQLLRIVWGNIAEKSREEIDNIIRGQKDNNQVNKPQTELQKLISEHIVNMHVEIQKMIKEAPAAQNDDQALQLQGLVSEHIAKMHVETTNSVIKAPETKSKYSSRILFLAAETGNTKFVVELIRQYPDLIWKVNDDNFTIFHIAVKHRHEGIYNLLYEIGSMKDLITPLKDQKQNNMLHLVGKRAKRNRLEDVSGVALQMQRELLWFKEVEGMIPPSYRERKNEDGLTPYELFTKEHKDLMSQGEKWMKDTASQCMVVAALIATIVFAAAFTVPGGYNQNDGMPIFYPKATFMVFVVADAISLFASSASILMFLSILTSRYAQRDFLESLPKKLMLGLATLFLSIVTMTIAFSVSFFVLYHKGLLWMPILIGAFAVMPVLLYVLLQYGLFFDVYRSTYISRYLFKPQKHVLYYKHPKV